MEPPRLKSPMKPPLITPSASPPPLRTEIRYSRAISESAPPSKRQRTVSTPRPTTQGTPGPSSSLQDPTDIHQERRASTMRLLEFWDSLASCTRALDDDDIVDVMTGKITRDNGVLRNSDKFTFGVLDAPSTDCVTSDDEGSDIEENEYDPDELDAFVDEDVDAFDSDGDDGLELDAGGKLMPPVTPLDPADADDLREFMEAERKRRELCGTDIEDEEERDTEEYAELEEGIADGNPSDEDQAHPPPSDTGTEEGEKEEEKEAERESEVSGPHNHYSEYFVPLDSASDDELDNWAVDDANIVYPVAKSEAKDEQSEIEIIETVPVPKQQNNSKGKGSIYGTPSQSRSQSKPKHTPKPARQLYTPPQSNSSSGPSATPMDPNFIDLSADSTPSPPTSPVSRPFLAHSPKKVATSPMKRVQDPVANSDLSNDIDSRGHGTSAQRSSVSKVGDSSIVVKDTPKRTRPPASSSTGQTPKLKAFVLLTPRKSSSPQKIPSSRSDDIQGKLNQASPDKQSKGKSKVKEGNNTSKPRKDVPPNARKQLGQTPQKFPSAPKQNSPPNPHPSSSKSLQTRTPASEDESWFATSANEPNSRYTPDNLHLLSPTFPSPPIPRKRKRMLSDSETEPPRGAVEPMVEILRRPTNASSQHASTSRSPEDNVKIKRNASKRTSSQRRRRTPESESGSESSTSNPGGDYRPHSHYNSNPHTPSHYSYPHLQASYPPLHHPLPGYSSMPDPRAHLIITQAMQQLSALVGTPWIPPHQYHENTVPHTPSHRHHSSRPSNPPFITPTHHHHPYPYSYDPNLSRATLPPDSPDVSSLEKSSTSRRKSLVRRSRSRGRRVSFHVEDDHQGYDAEAINSSPSERRPSKGGSSNKDREDRPKHEARPKSSKGKDRAQTPHVVSEEHDDDALSDISDRQRGCSIYSRGQTPGPSFGSPGRRQNTSASSFGMSGKEHSRHDYRGG